MYIHMYQYLLTLILLACICPTTLATDSLGRTQNPAPIHHKKLLKHRAPPLDSVFDYGTLRPCNDASVSSNPYMHIIHEGEG